MLNIYYYNCCGIDVHKKMLVATIANVKVNIKLIKKYKVKLIKKFNVVFPENVIDVITFSGICFLFISCFQFLLIYLLIDKIAL